jgi:hypothetical protein
LDRDSRLKEKLKDIKIFECLNVVKATPLLLDLTKKTSSLDWITNVRDSNGRDFVSDEERNDFICNYYSELYKVDNSVAGSIKWVSRPGSL